MLANAEHPRRVRGWLVLGLLAIGTFGCDSLLPFAATSGAPTDAAPTDARPNDATPNEGPAVDGHHSEGPAPTDGRPADGPPSPTDGPPADGPPAPADGPPAPADGPPGDLPPASSWADWTCQSGPSPICLAQRPGTGLAIACDFGSSGIECGCYDGSTFLDSCAIPSPTNGCEDCEAGFNDCCAQAFVP